jgi:hypothetical protein
MPNVGGWRFVVLGVVIAVMLVLPLVVKSSFAVDILIRVLLFSFIGSAWNLMGGYAKQLSLGHAARPWCLYVDTSSDRLRNFTMGRHGRRRLCRHAR